MGPLQFGLPNPNLIPQTNQLCVLDLKDCFFTIPLCPQDCKKFTFTVPEYNNQRPSQRYQWKVLTQGMQNSPTLCQLFVDRALAPFRARYPTLKVYHYMDDILLSGPQVTAQQLEYLSFTPPRNIYPYLDALSDLVRKARHCAVQLTGTDLVAIVFPLSCSEFDSLYHSSLAWQVALCDYVGQISYNPPKDPRLVITQKVPLIVHRLSRSRPIVSAITLFTDGSPHRGVVTYQLGDPPRWHSHFTLPQHSAQRSELAAVILAFQLFADCPFNLIVDTHYVLSGN
ncbi:unnamed protein product [Eretmochelys imbricata]